MYIHRSGFPVKVIAPDLFQKLVPGENHARVFHKHLEQLIFLEGKVNPHSSVKWERNGKTQSITVCAVKCCSKGLYLSSESVTFHYSDEYETLPPLLEGDWDIYFLAEKLANDLGIRFYK